MGDSGDEGLVSWVEYLVIVKRGISASSEFSCQLDQFMKENRRLKDMRTGTANAVRRHLRQRVKGGNMRFARVVSRRLHHNHSRHATRAGQCGLEIYVP